MQRFCLMTFSAAPGVLHSIFIHGASYEGLNIVNEVIACGAVWLRQTQFCSHRDSAYGKFIDDSGRANIEVEFHGFFVGCLR